MISELHNSSSEIAQELKRLEELLRQDAEAALHLSNEILSVTHETYQEIDRAWALFHRASAYNKLNKFSESLQDLHYAAEIFLSHAHQLGYSRVLLRRSVIYRKQMNWKQALEDLSTAEEIVRIEDDKKVLAEIYRSYGLLHRALGQHLTSARYFKNAVTLVEEIGNPYELAKSYNSLGGVYFIAEEFEKALQYFRKAIEISEQVGSPNIRIVAADNIANVYYTQGELEKANEYRREALGVARSLKDYNKVTFFLSNLGALEIKRKEYKTAEEALTEALTLAEEAKNTQVLPFIYTNLGELCNAKKEYTKAIEMLVKALSYAELNGGLDILSSVYIALAQSYEGLKEQDIAIQYYKKYITAREQYEKENNRQRISQLEAQHKIDQVEKEKALIRLRNIELSELNQELEALNKQKDELLQIVSHDLRSPLSTVIGMANLINTTYDELTSKDVVELSSYIESSSRKLLDLVNNLLSVTQLDSDKIRLELASTDVKELIEDSVQLFQPLATQKAITLQTEVNSELPNVSLDRAKLSQALNNLLSNAIKFTSLGGTITINARHEDMVLKIAVEDNGIGISEEVLPLLFTKFSTHHHGTQGERGTGLGLAIVKHFVELHGGEVSVTSKLSEGSSFIIHIPVEMDSNQ